MPDPDWLINAKKKGLEITEGPKSFFVGFMTEAPELTERLGHVVRSCRTEAPFQKCVVELATALGWRVVITRKVFVKGKGGMRYETPFNAEGVGSFDLDFYRERNFKAELKAKGGSIREEQKQWKLRYDRARVENYIWWPKNWEEIVETLTVVKQWSESQCSL